ncbi:ATP-binding protein [Microbacterium sp. SSM24]|uniref:ATP-binding protein n=1 Tax=Microbacterium sp. SSM24 TaxID=2991714 RepID=UPI002226FAFD|nr:LuxR family transcriptional regulator [Microbacterium sp. SSM24]MCW3493813.1 AAA family ATPase [Microbacterium sp. SSM24]
MGLFERASQLDELAEAVRRIRATDGSWSGAVVTVAGDAGAGKTSLIGAALADLPAGMRVLRAGCDPLTTPRPLGPIRDVQQMLGDTTAAESLLGVEARFTADVAAVPTVLVIDDAQWIDAASVEVLRFLLRRIESLPVALVIAHREVPLGHDLLALLGDSARMDSAVRLSLPPLSADAVRQVLGEHKADPERVLALTGGNPFFVAEIARHRGEGLPRTVRDAVISSTTGLTSDELEALQLIATAPDAFDDRLLPYMDIDVPTLRRLEATGLLVRSRGGIAFRHELARLAIVESSGLGAAPLLHRRVLDAWERVGTADDAVLTHHAAAAGDPERTLRYAALAAEDATRTGSHTEAVAFLTLALAQLDSDTAERAGLLEQLSTEQYMVSRLQASLSSIDAALRIREHLNDGDGISTAHDRRAVVEYYSARRREAERHADAAASSGAGPDAQASAQATRAYLAYRRHDLETARGIAAAQRAAPTTDAASLRLSITEAASDLVDGRTAAREELVRHANSALRRSLDEIGTTAYSNLSALDIEHRRLSDAEAVLAESIPLTIDRDIPVCRQWQTGMRSRLHLLRGRWAASAEDAAAVLDDRGAPLAAAWPHIVSAQLGMRRGGADEVDAHLAAAWALSIELDEALVSLAVRSATAELAWHRGRPDARLDDAERELAMAWKIPGTQWAAGDLRVWLARLGRNGIGSPDLPEPYRLELDGQHAKSAKGWRDLGVPYDAALAALHSSDEATAAAGLAALDALDVPATAARARANLTARGIRSLPSRPRAGTAANPSGLTNRQLDVARLVARGLTNAELAAELYISPKTADHHVSAVLAKLGMASRRDIVRSAPALGLD